jgi:hypothetical protein
MHVHMHVRSEAHMAYAMHACIRVGCPTIKSHIECTYTYIHKYVHSGWRRAPLPQI